MVQRIKEIKRRCKGDFKATRAGTDSRREIGCGSEEDISLRNCKEGDGAN